MATTMTIEDKNALQENQIEAIKAREQGKNPEITTTQTNTWQELPHILTILP